MKQAFLYSAKIWLTTIIVSPLLVGILLNDIDIKLISKEPLDFFGALLFIMVFGMVVCIPSYVLQVLLFFYLNRKRLTTWHVKLYLSIFALFLSILSFAILNCELFFDVRYSHSLSDFIPGDIISWVISVWIILTACIWLYKYKPPIIDTLKPDQPLT